MPGNNWHALAVHCVWPAGRTGRLRRVALRLRGGFLPVDWVCGVLRPTTGLAALDLDLHTGCGPIWENNQQKKKQLKTCKSDRGLSVRRAPPA